MVQATATDRVVTAAAPVTGGAYIHWGAAVAGALVGAAISLVLMAFAAGVGLSIASPSPTWRNASVGLALLSGVWILVTAVGSYAAAGYIAGRMRARLGPAPSDEVDFRDGMHGAIAWAIATILGALLLMAQTLMLVPALAEREGSAPSATRAGAGEPRYVSYEIDRMLRGERKDAAADPGPPVRAEVGRLLLAALDQRTFTPEDRSYLVRLVSARTGLSPGDAERRVDGIITQTRERANRWRRSGVVTAFIAAASLVIGFAAAWFAACAGGRHRDGETIPSFTTDLRRPRISLR